MSAALATRLLLVEDSPGDARLFREMLSEAGSIPRKITHVSGMTEAERHLARHAVDIILLDLGLPDVQGLESIRRARSAAPHIPLVVLTGLDDESLAFQALQQGAQDYLVKGQIEARGLLRALGYAIERKLMEEALWMEKEQMRAVTEELERSNIDLQDFATIASHDLQEPLRKIQAFGDRLEARLGGALDDEGVDYLKRMTNAANRMQTLINDLLEYSQVTAKPQEPRPVDLGRLVAEVLSDLDERIRLTHGHVAVGPLPTILASPLQMRQLFQNLIGNALKFHPVGVAPEVQVAAVALDPRRGGRSGQAHPAIWEIRVQDNGIGLEQQYLERIFAPFERLHGRDAYEGTGMGLAICRRIVARRGGTLTATSEVGAGSTFLITLPESASVTDMRALSA